MFKRLSLALASLIMMAVVGIAISPSAHAVTRDTSENAIIKGGALTLKELQDKLHANPDGDLYNIFSHYKYTSEVIWGQGTKEGRIYKNGNVVVDGKVVATKAHSLGRENWSGSREVTIAGKKYYERSDTRHFKADYIEAFVFFKDGEYFGAVMKSCGNPVIATPVPKPKPTSVCTSLKKIDDISRTMRRFQVKASASNGARIVNYTYSFSDGSKLTSTNTIVTHNFKQDGPFSATVTANVDIKGKITPVTSPGCAVKGTIAPPPVTPVATCDELEAELIQADEHRYKYTLDYTTEGGAVLTSVDFNFGDGSSRNNVTPGQLDTVEHAYAKDSEHTTTATLHFTVAQQKRTDKCTVKITPTTTYCKPGIPVGDERCEEEAEPAEECKPGVPMGSDECEQVLPAELPVTGPMELLGGGLGIGSLTAAGYHYRNSQRHLISKFLKK